MGWHDSCYNGNVERKEYEKLVSDRETLKSLLEGPVSIKQHRVELERQLSEIRGKIKNAHREHERNKQVRDGR